MYIYCLTTICIKYKRVNRVTFYFTLHGTQCPNFTLNLKSSVTKLFFW